MFCYVKVFAVVIVLRSEACI